jgi:peptide/nickel transport system substrate-binding protein
MSLVAGPSLAILDRHREAALQEAFVPYREALSGFMDASRGRHPLSGTR